MELFKGQNLLEFTERFKTDLDCEEYLIPSSQRFFTYLWYLQTAHYFMQKVREAMKSSESHKMNDKRIVERSPVSQSQLVCS